MLRSVYQEKVNEGTRRVLERGSKFSFDGTNYVAGEPVTLSDGSDAVLPAEARFLMNYFAGNTNYIPMKNQIGGVVQIAKRDTGCISVLINESNTMGRGKSVMYTVNGTKTIQPDVPAEAFYIHAIETCYRAGRYYAQANGGMLNPVYETVMDRLAEVRDAIYFSTGINADKAKITETVKALNDAIYEAIEDATREVAKVVDPSNEVPRSYTSLDYNKSPDNLDHALSGVRGYNPKVELADTSTAIDYTAAYAVRNNSNATYTRTTRRLDEKGRKNRLKKMTSNNGVLSKYATPGLVQVQAATATATATATVSAPVAPAAQAEPETPDIASAVADLETPEEITQPQSRKPTYPSVHKEYIHKTEDFYMALIDGEYHIDLDEYAPLIAKCYADAGEVLTEAQIAEMLADAKTKIPGPAVLERYVPIKEFQTMLLSVRNNLTDALAVMKDAADNGQPIPYNVLMSAGVKNWYLVGPPSSGKSISASALAAALGLPYYSINASRNAEEDMFQGGTGIVNGKTDNTMGPYVQGIHNIVPSIVSVEEMNALAPGVALVINSHCETPYSINLFGNGMVRRNPCSFIVASGNRDLAGLQEQNLALLSRFAALNVEAPTKAQIEKIAQRIVPQASPESVAYAVECYDDILRTVKQENWDMDKDEMLQGFTIRGLGMALNLISSGIPPKESVKTGLLNTLVSQSESSHKVLADFLDAKPVPPMPETER